MFLRTGNKQECTGCGLCKNVCMQNAIYMAYDKRGFLYPCIDKSKCKHCGECINRCPITYNGKVRNKSILLSGEHRNSKVVAKSSSGGAFTALCQTFLNGEKSYRIYGATMLENGYVEHVGISDIRCLNVMRKSKYLQSDTTKIYKEIKEVLNRGNKVIFSGVPCQIAALQAYLEIEYNNLLCIELLCRGVSSPLVFKKYIQSLEKIYQKKVIRVDMRDKKDSDKNIHTRVFFDDNTTITNVLAQSYMEFYRTSRYYRNSCYACRRRISQREYTICGDVVIGDYCDIKNKKNISFILLKDTDKIDMEILENHFEGKTLNYKDLVNGNRDFIKVNLPTMKSYQIEKIDVWNLIIMQIRNKLEKK